MGQRVPLAGGGVQPLDGKGFATGAAGGRLVGKHRLARDQCVKLHRGDEVNQRVKPATAVGDVARHGAGGHQRGVLHRVAHRLRFGRAAVQRGLDEIGRHIGREGFGLWQLGRIAARGPGAVRHHGSKDQSTQNGEANGQIAHAACTNPTAASMSTATMRDTPCSCMVTPISCTAISIAILLWLMNRNCVSLLILLTSLA